SNSQTTGARPTQPYGPKTDGAGAKDAPPSGAGGEAIDTSEYDAKIERLQKQVDKKGASDAEKRELARAYLERAKALTKAHQYRVALGDYRRTLRYDPGNQEAQQMAGTIISILQSMGHEVPAEGREPAPLPYKKG
ncbi:MAG TPA: hypothetical protein VF507_05165, partial [Pyrinomonadaceae bacterium]